MKKIVSILAVAVFAITSLFSLDFSDITFEDNETFTYQVYCAYQGSTVEFNNDSNYVDGCHFEVPFFTFGFNWSESFPIKKYYLDYHGTSWHTIYPCIQVMDFAVNFPLRYVRPSVGVSVWMPEPELKIDGTLLDTAVSLYLCATTAIPDFPIQAGLGFRTAPSEYKKYGVDGALTFSVGFDAVWLVRKFIKPLIQ